MRINAGLAASRITATSIFSMYIAVAACGPVAPGEEPGSTTGDPSTGAPATSDAPPTTGTSGALSTAASTSDGSGETTTGPVLGTTSGSSSGTTGEPCDFICPGDTSSCGLNGGGPGDGLGWRCSMPACDVFQQDCPEGMKCAAKADGGGGSWNATTCTPVTGDGEPGEPCTAEAGLTGADDCRKGAMCWEVDKETLIGTCVELCTGNPDSPMCSNEAELSCAVTNGGVLNLCLPACDPLMQDCAGEDLCIPVQDNFLCVFDNSGEGGQAFGPCEAVNACDAGLLCLDPAAATECDPNAGGCCLPFCDLSDANAVCPGAGQSCVPFHEEGMAPPELMNVGVCAIPS